MSRRTKKIESLIAEEVKRFTSINTYVDPLDEQFLGIGNTALQFEQEEPGEGEAGDELLLGDEEGKTPEGEEETIDFEVGGEETPEAEGEKIEDEGEETEEGGTEELDVTDIVTMTKETGEKAENLEQSISAQQDSVDSLISKLDGLEKKLGEMDKIVSSVNKLEDKIEKYRPQTPQEKLELRYLDSGPFNQKLGDYWEEKTGEMAKQKDKHEYVLTQGEVDDYNEADIKKSWVYDKDEEEENPPPQ